MSSRFASIVTLLIGLFLLVAKPISARAELQTEVTQYGITWTFAAPAEVGQYVTGDYWVVGPLTIIEVSPKPGPACEENAFSGLKSRYGTPSLVADQRMRHGSMVFPLKSLIEHGIDSRSISFNPELCATYPLELQPGQTLLSTISSETLDTEGKLATPYMLGELGFFLCKENVGVTTSRAAILTCVTQPPPDNAFRPSYARTQESLYTTEAIHWDRLLRLAPVEATPDWSDLERVFERPWLDFLESWTSHQIAPSQNQPIYGREFARMSSYAALMLSLDVPNEQKRELLLNYLQLGIDLQGLALAGRNWFSDGGHWHGRKWPILFASILLDAPELRTFPTILELEIEGRRPVIASAAVPEPKTLFQEDLDTYYGEGAYGQIALWQIVFHSHSRPTYQEKEREDYTPEDRLMDSYCANNAGAALGVALVAQLMEAKPIWGHNAFFDYLDYWMSPEQQIFTPYAWLPEGCTRSFDPFFEAMWREHRPLAPESKEAAKHFRWIWSSGGKTGQWNENPKPILIP